MSLFLDSYIMLFNNLKNFDVEFIKATELGDDGKDLIVCKLENQSNKKAFVLIIKSLSVSSRNPDSEFIYQVIHAQRERIDKLAKKYKAIPIYAGWNSDLGVILIPAYEKVAKSANQGSIYLSKELIVNNSKKLKNSILIKRISDAEVYANNIITENNIGNYFLHLMDGRIDFQTGHPSTHQVMDLEFIELPETEKEVKSGTVKATSKFREIVNPRNVILYGPPGTGKTRAALILANDLFETEETILNADKLTLASYPKDFEDKFGLNFLRVQFHPSFSYEDFFEGLRPIQVTTHGKTEISYMVVPGIFKIACQLARAYNDPTYGIELNAQYIRDEKEETGVWCIGEGTPYSSYRLSERDGRLEFRGNKVQETGKSKSNFAVITEHEPKDSGIYAVKWFSNADGANSKFVLFIDELNRGNPAKVFGEALSLIEESKRIGGAEQGEIYLPYSHEKFQVPQNLHIICSMNTSDRSLTNLDQAFRRRFEFVYLPPMFEIVENETFKANYKISKFSDEVLTSLKQHFTFINEALGLTGVSPENFLGHSYMLKLIRNSWKDLRKLQTQQKTIDLDKDVIKKVVLNSLESLWTMELHSQLREIIGEHRLNDFCDHFSTLYSKEKNPGIFNSEGGNMAKNLKSFLTNPLPENSKFPWKAVAA